MKILGLEFSSPQRSVAAVEVRAEEPLVLAEVIETGPGSMRPLAMIEEALRQARIEREQIECLAVGLGPGSYTGIRTAIALAQGWQLGRGIKLLGISSAECIAAEAQAAGLTGRVHVIIDAQRNEFYLAAYELKPAQRRGLSPLRLACSSEVQQGLASGGLLVGPEVTRWFPEGRLLFPRAATLARLSVGETDFLSGEELGPIYLRETSFVKAPPPRIIP
ncbi:MAG TPA: tRNA (adenosine(37)-N6)-threonylcarbamoyltransferase complex dimerization subunit type 1 TsaB [Verrucomicrobiae bacterium]|nr:tRNA (adenosine(37)-N6)-threonylcarbamoyltransferase complex dimerization subunit type 1 TsaB [Verrucomicrobiae bacterium]